MKTITVEVTQEDIDNGLRGNCAECPVALALNRATGEEWNVGLSVLVRTRDEFAMCYSETVHDFILRFDHLAPVAPFRFTIEVPE